MLLALLCQPALLPAETGGPVLQPFAAACRRLVEALHAVGAPLSGMEMQQLASGYGDPARGTARIQQVLDAHVLLQARINPEGRVSVSRGLAGAELVEQGWRAFLVKVNNEAGASALFKVYSAQAEPVGRVSDEAPVAVRDATNGAVDALLANERWLGLDNWTKPPLSEQLSGLSTEYRLLMLYSRDRGRREASLEAVLGDEEQDLGFRSTLAILFDCQPAHTLTFNILDVDEKPVMASVTITDKQGRLYPAQNKRMPPDIWFERHVYRSSGETIRLPVGEYALEYGRGPEYLRKTAALLMTGVDDQQVNLRLERWVTPKRLGYYSGDTHIHAAGCSHYESPSEGVTPEVVYRQISGEALDLGDVLTWGPGYYYQKQFFTGHVRGGRAPEQEPAMMRYDVEVSGFPSSHCGHLVLLGLRDQNYPAANQIDQWPSWNGPILEWARSQSALAGYAHAGHGLNVASTALPNYLMPPFDSMGANEYIADVTHEGLVSFISGCDTRPFAELNIWYHTLNCGFRTIFVGETDFPCLSDERVGGGRTYVEMSTVPKGDTGYAAWLAALVTGQSYAGDGRSHIFHFSLTSEGGTSSKRELHIPGPGRIRVTARVAAWLEPVVSAATEHIRSASPYDKPYWHLERARVAASRQVTCELVVNGLAVQSCEIIADGSQQDVGFDLPVDKSSWIALRILPSAHTNPQYVLVGEMPVRASRKSAMWCREAVDVCWGQKSKRIRPQEMHAAAAAFEHARLVYDRIVAQCVRGEL